MKGRTLDGLMHLADWFPTICSLAGVDPQIAADTDAGYPAVDGYDLWPYLSGAEAKSPRNEIMFGPERTWGLEPGTFDGLAGSFIHGTYKYVFGVQK